MRRGFIATVALTAGFLPAITGCASERSELPASADAGRMDVEVDPHGPWTEAAPSATSAPAGPIHAPLAIRAEAPDAPPPTLRTPPPGPPARSAPLSPPLAVPRARGTGEVAKRGAPPVKPLEAVARERFLDHPTEVHADALTLVLPARLLREARLTGTELTEPAPGRRVAAGAARLTCRELTLVGERITLRTRSDGTEDVQITARGNVDFVSRRGEHVVREQGLRTLLVNNDSLTPLR